MKSAVGSGISRRHFAKVGLSTGAALLVSRALFAAGNPDPGGEAGAADSPAMHGGTSASFGPLKQIDAGRLNVGYAEAGPADGPAIYASAWLAL